MKLTDKDIAEGLRLAELASPGLWKPADDCPMVRSTIPATRDPEWCDWIATMHPIPMQDAELPMHNAANIAFNASPERVRSLYEALRDLKKIAELASFVGSPYCPPEFNLFSMHEKAKDVLAKYFSEAE